MKKVIVGLVAALFPLAWTGLAPGAEVPSAAGGLERVAEVLVPPPFAPKHEQVATGPAQVIQVRLVIEEKQVALAPGGPKVWVMTFGGTVPGPLIVAHQDDYVEVTLVNPATNTLEHNIDFHAATGALGGGALTHVRPGEEAVLRFKATKAGVFVYHCAPGGAMIPWHVVSGMNGAIMILPRDGLRDAKGRPVRYDRVVYIGEQDFYVPRDEKGAFIEYSSPVAGMGDTLNVMRTLTPTHVVFNGAVGALTGDGALRAKVGERVLIIHAEANRDSRPHLIGGHGDLVWTGGSFSDPPATDRETWFVPGGSAVAALYTFRQPGLYAYVTHNLIEAILLGAAANFQVEGDWNHDLMEQVQAPAPVR
jgi:nitrite reductase (NO-forming)